MGKDVENNEKKNNHYIPWLHIKKWYAIGAKVFDKKNKKIFPIKEKDRGGFFAERHFYSHDKSDELENRIMVFETYIGKIIKKIDNEEKKVNLTGKELYLTKLYCFLCACRQNNTTDLIMNDESGLYKSNDYYIGIPKIQGKDEIIKYTTMIIEEFEIVKKDEKFIDLECFSPNKTIVNDNKIRTIVSNMHLCVFRNEEKNIALSSTFAVIENTMDNDHLYTFVPISPKTALTLVNSKYYLTEESLEVSKIILPLMNGGTKDDYLSSLFQDDERPLLCSYYLIKLEVAVKETFIPRTDFSNITVKISEITDEVVEYFNSIMYENGRYFIFKDDLQLNKAKRELLDRKITI